MEIIETVLHSLDMDISELHYRRERDTVSLTIHATDWNKEILWKKIKSTLPRKLIRFKNAYL
jgi:hypothetical protein